MRFASWLGMSMAATVAAAPAGALAARFLPTYSGNEIKAPPEKTFVADAITADTSQIMVGHFAHEKSSSAAVRALGKMIVSDDARGRTQLRNLSYKLRMKPPTSPTKEAANEFRQLKHLSGKAFDRSYVAFVVRSYKRRVRTYETERAARNGAAGHLAKLQLPALKKHLSVAAKLVGGRENGTVHNLPEGRNPPG